MCLDSITNTTSVELHVTPGNDSHRPGQIVHGPYPQCLTLKRPCSRRAGAVDYAHKYWSYGLNDPSRIFNPAVRDQISFHTRTILSLLIGWLKGMSPTVLEQPYVLRAVGSKSDRTRCVLCRRAPLLCHFCFYGGKKPSSLKLDFLLESAKALPTLCMKASAQKASRAKVQKCFKTRVSFFGVHCGN
jgi:hypothetical protein